MEWNFRDTEQKWQQEWADKQVYKTTENKDKPKFYVLDMFPYPSGAGLHVGHPLGYIASDIIARYKTLKGFNVLHPMGFDAFGLPAEQYAIQTGQHPAVTTAKNIETYKKQLKLLGFNYDWDREVNTSDPEYYRWTQWIFLKLFNAWYNLDTNKAEPISSLIEAFEKGGSHAANGFTPETFDFSHDQWKAMTEKQKMDVLMQYRLAYQDYATVNWCEALGTVLANDEVKDGLSERGGHPVEKKQMRQWFLRITAYAERLLNDLDTLDWSDAMKDMQRNWIGKSEGASVRFNLTPNPSPKERGTPTDETDANENIFSANISHNNMSQHQGDDTTKDSGRHYDLSEPAPRYYTTSVFNQRNLLQYAKEMRKNMTPAEKHLWKFLRNRLEEYKFRRQHIIDTFIADFVCLEKGLIIEADGEIHLQSKERDDGRDDELLHLGFKTIRFSNERILEDTEAVLKEIKTELENRPNREIGTVNEFSLTNEKVEVVTSPSPLERGSGGEVKEQVEDLTLSTPLERGSGGEVKKQVEDFNLSTPLERGSGGEVKKQVEDFNLSTPLEKGSGGEVKEQVEDFILSTPLEKGSGGEVEVFTTRPDTIFGVSFLVLAPEHELVFQITTPEQKEAVEAYVEVARNRSERERQADVKRISGVFTGAYALHPFTGDKIPVWIGDYVLAGYGTGAVMAVPAGDQRDYDFAKYFNLPIPAINEGVDISEKADPTKDARMINSGFLDGLTGREAIAFAIKAIEEKGIGKGRTQYRLRDAGFSRQRYWGEPFPIVYQDGIAYPLEECELPLALPEVKSYQPTGAGASPLAAVTEWVNLADGAVRETDTMPGYAGSSWYFLRYMDPRNQERFVGKDAEQYWQDVDVYIGGTEHAVGHLMYARFWQKALYDLGFVSKKEPFKKLINQGMILGVSAKLIVRPVGNENRKLIILPPNENFNSLITNTLEINFPVEFLKQDVYNNKSVYVLSNSILSKTKEKYHYLKDIEWPDEIALKLVIEDEKNMIDQILRIARHIEENYEESEGYNKLTRKYYELDRYYKELDSFASIKVSHNVCLNIFQEIEKMSKSKYNVVNPDDIVAQYGADTLRLYEMFLGPLEQAKPWNTNGIEGVHRFLLKLWRLFHNQHGEINTSDEKPNEKELRALHKLIKKVEEDIENFSFNTSVSSFMICVNELSELKCNKIEILRDLLIVLSPYAPHICEELWHRCGFEGFVVQANWPAFNEAYLKASTVNYPVSFNGKTRFNIEAAAELPSAEVEKLALAHKDAAKWLDGKVPKKVIVVPGRIVNVVV
jgi:leucyl-tRNA synthetase